MDRKNAKRTIMNMVADAGYPMASETEAIEKLILKKLGTYIATQRKQKGITQKELNNLSSVSLAVIADLENGKSMPRVETLIRLAIALKINVNDIFETMKCDTNNALMKPIKAKSSRDSELASAIAGFGYEKNMVNEIMDFISFIEYKYKKNNSRH